jgi:hypothetical protein
MEVIWGEREAKYFLRRGLDRANQVDPVQQIGIYAQVPTANMMRRLPLPHALGCEVPQVAAEDR